MCFLPPRDQAGPPTPVAWMGSHGAFEWLGTPPALSSPNPFRVSDAGGQTPVGRLPAPDPRQGGRSCFTASANRVPPVRSLPGAASSERPGDAGPPGTLGLVLKGGGGSPEQQTAPGAT